MTWSPPRALGWTVLIVALLSIPFPSRADDEPWGFELAFDHGLSWAKHPGSEARLVSGRLGLDARLHSPSGIGVVLRAGIFPTPFPMTSGEVDLGASYRGWLLHAGPRGLQLGGALGLSAVAWSGNPQRPGVSGLVCVLDAAGTGCRDPHDERFGPFGEVHLDDREHSLLLGVAVLARWLPGDLASEDDRLGFAWVTVMMRVGGEVEL